LNIPLELIFIVLFFVLPALGNLQKHLRERRQRGAEPARRPTPGPERPEAAPTRAKTGQPGWLEEAQRRVREAQREEAEHRGRGSVNPRPRTPLPQAARPARTPRSVQTRPVQPRLPTPGSLEGRSLETLRPERSSLESSDATALDTAPPLRVQRLGGGGRATIRPYELRFDEATLMTGFIWHQVLSPPLSKSRRTRLSRRQP